MDREAVIRYNDLLAQADKITSMLKRAMKNAEDIEAGQQFYNTYMQWYSESYSMLPDDVRPDFEKPYAISFGGMPSIQQIMELFQPEESTSQIQRRWSYLRSFPICFEEQV